VTLRRCMTAWQNWHCRRVYHATWTRQGPEKPMVRSAAARLMPEGAPAAGEPITKSPAGTTTVSGHVPHSLKRSSGTSAPSPAEDNGRAYPTPIIGHWVTVSIRTVETRSLYLGTRTPIPCARLALTSSAWARELAGDRAKTIPRSTVWPGSCRCHRPATSTISWSRRSGRSATSRR